MSAGGPLRALAELRLRMLWRRLRGGSGVPELVARIATFAFAIPAGLVFAGLTGAGAYQAARAGPGLRSSIPVAALYFGVWQTWMAVSLSVSDRSQLDLRRFLVYPLPPARVYGYGLAASVLGDPFTWFWCLLLLGAFAGAALARPGAWLVLLALVSLGFVAATAAMAALVQELLGRLLRGRRVRELGIAAVYLGLAFLLLSSSGGPRPGVFQAIRTLARFRWLAYPAALASEAGAALFTGHAAAALPWIAALLAAGALSGWAAYRLALADARSGAEGAGGAGGAARAAGRGWGLPGRLAPLLEKELKYLARHPLVTVLALIVPALSAFFGWKVAPHLPAEAGEVVRLLPLVGLAMYTHLATEVFWLNAFGGDRGGARAWFLAPVPLEDALAAKNVAVYALALGLFAASAAALTATAGSPPAWAIAAALALHAGAAPWFLAAGNLVSVLVPRAASTSIQRGGRLSPLTALAGMALVSAVSAVFAVPVVAALRLEAPWLVAASWAALGALGLWLYRRALPRTARLLSARREALLAAVAGDEE
ncbi:hypothetical protein [Anaeromyxobacter dehalogenans]|uniref:Uncharacterized protein n=1 Tax=Anaeromyxobacter dehalogenans (strain 2CP-C) TaxID=290397 RepID=Q2IIR3_ANADE|nr:hypothetical protein [Anaeromyxobacter dehalogenans]ABC81540.1 hypothetical protein Adeh_1767 [Anaeromyxobacter dehalogenans 2CP-C]